MNMNMKLIKNTNKENKNGGSEQNVTKEATCRMSLKINHDI